MICRLLYWLRLSKWDPSSLAFKQAFADAFNAANAQRQGAPSLLAKGDTNRASPWPVVLFMSFIVTAPYLIMKLLGNMTTTAQEEGKRASGLPSTIISMSLIFIRFFPNGW